MLLHLAVVCWDRFGYIFFFQAEDGIRDLYVTGVQTCALPIFTSASVSLGAFVQPEAELFRVADPSKIQVEAAINPSDIARLAAGDRAIVELNDGCTVEGRVRAVTPTLSGETRSATALIEVPGGVLQPGLGVRVRLMPSQGTATNAIVVPENAVQSVDGRDAVFVRTPQGFRARFVTLGHKLING